MHSIQYNNGCRFIQQRRHVSPGARAAHRLMHIPDPYPCYNVILLNTILSRKFLLHTEAHCESMWMESSCWGGEKSASLSGVVASCLVYYKTHSFDARCGSATHIFIMHYHHNFHRCCRWNFVLCTYILVVNPTMHPNAMSSSETVITVCAALYILKFRFSTWSNGWACFSLAGVYREDATMLCSQCAVSHISGCAWRRTR